MMGVRLWRSLRLLRYFLMFSWNANERHQSVAGNFSTVPAFSVSLKGNSQREQLDVHIQHRLCLVCFLFFSSRKCTKSPLAWFLNEVQKPIRFCSGPRSWKSLQASMTKMSLLSLPYIICTACHPVALFWFFLQWWKWEKQHFPFISQSWSV